MSKSIKILHIDPDYNSTYFINRPGSLIRCPISIKKAIKILKTEKFDLILSEPHNKAILNPQDHMNLYFLNQFEKISGVKRTVANN